jgi:hypothetical protein
MNRSKLLVAMMGGAAVLAFGPIAGAETTQARTAYTTALDHASLQYKGAIARCNPLAGHVKDMCVVQAKAVEKRSKASAEADYKGTIASRTDSQIANADADFMVAEAACGSEAGQQKDVCVKQAQATQVKQVSAAKAHKTAVDAQAGARDDTREAQYKVELAKCNAMSGPEKISCTTSAESAYGT